MHSSRKKIKIAVSVLFFVGVLLLLDLALYPCTFMRNDIHSVTTESFDYVILGTSNGKIGLVPDSIEKVSGKKGHNLCVGGEYPIDAYYIAKLIKEKQELKEIIFEVDPGYFMTEKEEGNNYLLFYHEFPWSVSKLQYYMAAILKCDLRTTFFPFYEYPISKELSMLGDTLYQKLTGNYDISYLKGTTQEYCEDGSIYRYPVNWKEFSPYTKMGFEDSSVKACNMEYMDKLIAFCKENDIEFKAVIMPLPDMTLRADQESFNNAWKYFSEYFDKKGIELYNFNGKYYKSCSHEIENYTDYNGHMNGESAKKFSEIFSKIVIENNGL